MTAVLRSFSNRFIGQGLQQPNGALKIDWTHPLSFGLVGYIPMGLRNMGNLVSGYSYTVPSGEKWPVDRVWACGPAFEFRDPGPNNPPRPQLTVNSTWMAGGGASVSDANLRFSIVGFGKTSVTNFDTPKGMYLEQSGTPLIYLEAGLTTNAVQMRYRNNSGTLLQVKGATTPSADEHMYGCSFTYGAANGVRVFLDGRLDGSDIYNTAGALDGASGALAGTGPFSWGTAGIVGADSYIYWIAIWNGRALTDAEHLQLYQDPYCFLLPAEDSMPIMYPRTQSRARIYNAVLQGGLTVIDTSADTIHILTDYPNSYAELQSLSIGNKAFAAGSAFGSPAPATPFGRKVASATISGGTVTRSGTATCWAAVAGSSMLAQGPLAAPVTVTSGRGFSMPSFNIILLPGQST